MQENSNNAEESRKFIKIQKVLKVQKTAEKCRKIQIALFL
jgi:hypothetical protein